MKKTIIKESILNHKEVLSLIDEDLISVASEILIDTINSGNKVFWCGNGGSASQANHLSAELIGGCTRKKLNRLIPSVLMLILLLLPHGRTMTHSIIYFLASSNL